MYATKAAADKPARGLFAVVTVRDRPTSDTAAAETAPTNRGGWQWKAPDGTAVGQDDGNATSVSLAASTRAGRSRPAR
ncbi:hypothetical protein ACFQ2B_07515 [Streptomyces stramineus]